jgi:hypothetical protein
MWIYLGARNAGAPKDWSRTCEGRCTPFLPPTRATAGSDDAPASPALSPLTRTIEQTELFPGARDNKAKLFPRARNVPKCVMARLLPRRKGPPCVSITIRRRGKPLILQQLVEQPRIVSAASLRLAKGAGLSLDSTGFRVGPPGALSFSEGARVMPERARSPRAA